jgi:hypothetical protein
MFVDNALKLFADQFDQMNTAFLCRDLDQAVEFGISPSPAVNGRTAWKSRHPADRPYRLPSNSRLLETHHL